MSQIHVFCEIKMKLDIEIGCVHFISEIKICNMNEINHELLPVGINAGLMTNTCFPLLMF